jgi:hypothetical protein
LLSWPDEEAGGDALRVMGDAEGVGIGDVGDGIADEESSEHPHKPASVRRITVEPTMTRRRRTLSTRRIIRR